MKVYFHKYKIGKNLVKTYLCAFTKTMQTDLIEFIFCDFADPEHQSAFISLLNHYMDDPMGDHPQLTPEREKELIRGMADHPASFVLFAKQNGNYIAFTTCFINFSTFKAKPYVNIHDVVVLKEYRDQGIGRKLLEKVIAICRDRDYCKITLEVRDDNANAKRLYHSLGFEECEPVMHFWTKVIYS